ncbi:MAG: DUF402 domain-containing protein [Syntrophobacteraceae bacterium]
MKARIKIRGIYSTALTKLVLDADYVVVDPSPMIRDRFGIEYEGYTHDLLVSDRDDLQGITILGQAEHVSPLVALLASHLVDVLLCEVIPEEDQDQLLRACVELPGGAKRALDEIRRSVLPTVPNHHRFRIVDAGNLESAEDALAIDLSRTEALGSQLFSELILAPLKKSGLVRLEHIRPSGKPMRPREGVLLDLTEGRKVLFKRVFHDGRYDGLDLPISIGDYGLTEIEEGAWSIKHSYFTKQGRLIGEYYNVNTPVELYPYGARYVDLEIDVVKRADEPPVIIDQEKLALLARQGTIGRSLEAKAVQTAERICRDGMA